jgi:hypothetical protein
MDRRCLRAPHDVERDGLVRVAAETFHFEITVTRIESIAKRGRWLRRSLKAELSAPAFVGCATIVGPFRDYQRDSIDAFYDMRIKIWLVVMAAWGTPSTIKQMPGTKVSVARSGGADDIRCVTAYWTTDERVVPFFDDRR